MPIFALRVHITLWMSEIFFYTFSDVCGIKEKLNINQIYVRYNGVIWRVHITLRDHDNNDKTFMCCSEGKNVKTKSYISYN